MTDVHDAELLAGLEAAAPCGVVADADLTAAAATDWTGRWRSTCRAVVRPEAEEQVARVLAVCHRLGVRVVVQGGNTGLVGGAVPDPRDVLLVLTRLRAVESIDPVTATAVVQAGVTLSQLQAAAGGHGLAFPVDLAARDAATLGGMAATNAGGVWALRHGSMRAHVLSVDSLRADGSVLTRLRPLVKDNAGYQLSSVLVGSEGTLGVITRLLVRLVPRAAPAAVALLGLPDLAAVVTVARHLRAVSGLRALEVVDRATLTRVCDHTQLPTPFPEAPEFLLLAEVAGSARELAALRDGLTAAVGALVEAEPDLPVVLAEDAVGIRELWAYRERATEAVAAAGTPVKLDVTLPTDQLDPLARHVHALGRQRAVDTYVWGHVGDGNLHVNLVGPAAADLEPAVLTAVLAAGGSISAEHGLGRAKIGWLGRAKPEEVRAMAELKAAFDPEGRLGVPGWAANVLDGSRLHGDAVST